MRCPRLSVRILISSSVASVYCIARSATDNCPASCGCLVGWSVGWMVDASQPVQGARRHHTCVHSFSRIEPRGTPYSSDYRAHQMASLLISGQCQSMISTAVNPLTCSWSLISEATLWKYCVRTRQISSRCAWSYTLQRPAMHPYAAHLR